jgi:hypothetical protein
LLERWSTIYPERPGNSAGDKIELLPFLKKRKKTTPLESLKKMKKKK